MSIHLPDFLIYFRVRVTNVSTSIFNFKVVNPVYKLERRRSQRCPIKADMATKVRAVADRLPLESITATVFNLSPIGVGILVKDFTLETRLNLGEKLTVNFSLGTLGISGSGTLQNRSYLQTRKLGKCLRLGIKFDGLDEQVKVQIAKFIKAQNLKTLD